MSGFGYDVGLDEAGMPELVERLESRRVLVTGASGLLGAGAQPGALPKGYEKKLEIQGVGYRVLSKGPKQLEFNLGFSHPVIVDAPEGITFAVENPTRFSVQGIDKQLVGEVAANIRKLRRPDPYKAKGVRYEGEHIRRKVGKAGK